MTSSLHTALVETLSQHFSLSKSCLTTLGVMIIALVNGRTVNLSHISSQFPGSSLQASNYRRLQRFFQYVRLDQDSIAKIIMGVLKLSRGQHQYLALDRTSWTLGNKDINVLVLAIITRRFRVPLFWTFLDHRGNSNTKQRIDLIQRYVSLFGSSSIDMLLADREFIGRNWMKFLSKNNVLFAIRVKSKMHLKLDSGETWPLKILLHGKPVRRSVLILRGHLPEADIPVAIAARQLKSGKWLIVMTNSNDPRKAMNTYKKRWAIECLFGDAKTRGLNMEDTRLVDPGKLSTLFAVLALAITWAYRCAIHVMGQKAIKRKSHGRPEKSWFRIGLDALRNWIIYQPDKAKKAWIKTFPKRLSNT